MDKQMLEILVSKFTEAVEGLDLSKLQDKPKRQRNEWIYYWTEFCRDPSYSNLPKSKCIKLASKGWVGYKVDQIQHGIQQEKIKSHISEEEMKSKPEMMEVRSNVNEIKEELKELETFTEQREEEEVFNKKEAEGMKDIIDRLHQELLLKTKRYEMPERTLAEEMEEKAEIEPETKQYPVAKRTILDYMRESNPVIEEV